MADSKDVQHLKDLIAHSEERAKLRLDQAMTKIDGALTLIAAQQETIKQELQAQRADNRTMRSESRAHFHWVIGTVLGTVIVVGAAVCAVVLSQSQIFGGGAQFGQSLQRAIQDEVRGAIGAQPSTQPTPHQPPH